VSEVKPSDQRLEEIRAWLYGETQHDPAVQREEWAAMVNELKQLRLRTASSSRVAAAATQGSGH
jgi:hypothetical protein